MSYDFPNTPALDATFTPPGGPSWKWNGTAWVDVKQSPTALRDEVKALRKRVAELESGT